MPQPQPVPDHLVTLAHRLADAAGNVIRGYFRTPVAVDDKPDRSPVTVADREAEATMRRLIAAAEPTHGVIGEELGADRADAEWVWVLDPIDGTKAFITGKPSFGTLIGLLHQGRPVFGVIDQPVTRERWIGGHGHPAALDGHPVRVRPCPELDRAYLYATDPDMFTGGAAEAFERLGRAVKLRRYGADCYAYALLASGFVDLVCECSLKLHDHIALTAVIEAAGGQVTDWRGEALGLATDVCVLAAGDPRCHAQAVALLAGRPTT